MSQTPPTSTKTKWGAYISMLAKLKQSPLSQIQGWYQSGQIWDPGLSSPPGINNATSGGVCRD